MLKNKQTWTIILLSIIIIAGVLWFGGNYVYLKGADAGFLEGNETGVQEGLQQGFQIGITSMIREMENIAGNSCEKIPVSGERGNFELRNVECVQG